MKTKVVLLIAAAMLAGISAIFAAGQVKTEKFKVHGNCSMCESRIEKAAKTVEGVTSADWEKKSMFLIITYDQSKADVHKIHAAIANTGHDTEMQRADDEVYEKLHSCCKYKRSEKKAESPKPGNAMSGCSNGAGSGSCCK